MTGKNGGAAFPRPAALHPDSGRPISSEQTGISVRDYFAGKALQGICASGPGQHMTNETIAKEAYSLADAMIKVRGGE